MTTSPKGRAFLEREEGVVLRAYRDVAGVWTIGAGLTAASGVVVPKQGMVITREEADRLLVLALQRNYEPAVRAAMPGASQTAFDAAVDFHWNTGGIGRASWVAAWKKRDWPAVYSGLMKWVRSGGKVLPGLKARREREFRLMREGIYTPLAPDPAPGRKVMNARIALTLEAAELAAVRAGLRSLGYDPGSDNRAIALVAVTRFQAAHDLTVDGILGRATLTTLQRRLDARRTSSQTVVAGGSGAASTQVPGVGESLPDTVILAGVGVVTALALLYLAWSYRDVVAAKIQRIAPKPAAWLRSI
jgi:lysozyme